MKVTRKWHDDEVLTDARIDLECYMGDLARDDDLDSIASVYFDNDSKDLIMRLRDGRLFTLEPVEHII